MNGFVCYNIGCICVRIRYYLKGKAYAVSVGGLEFGSRRDARELLRDAYGAMVQRAAPIVSERRGCRYRDEAEVQA